MTMTGLALISIDKLAKISTPRPRELGKYGADLEDRSAARLCLLQYGAAKAVPMRPDKANGSGCNTFDHLIVSCVHQIVR